MAGQGSLTGGSPALTEKEKFQRSIFCIFQKAGATG